MVSIPDSIVRSVKFSAPARGPPEPELKFTLQEVRGAGMVREVIGVPEIKAYPSFFSLEGSLMDSRAEQSKKTFAPISVMLSGRFREVREEHSEKTLYPK